MNCFLTSPRFLVAAALASVALGAASVAEARPEVYFSVDVQSSPAWSQPAPGYLVQPQPVYVQPRPIYVQPAPVYARPPVYLSPPEPFDGPRWDRGDARFEREREHAWRRAEWRRHQWREQFHGGDRDGDRDDRMRHHDHRD